MLVSLVDDGGMRAPSTLVSTLPLARSSVRQLENVLTSVPVAVSTRATCGPGWNPST